MLKHSSLEDGTVLDALTHQPWQVDCGVDADRCELLGVVHSRG
jgi:hypothetical protein